MKLDIDGYPESLEQFEDELLRGGTAFHGGSDGAAGDGRGGFFEERFGGECHLVERAFWSAMGIGLVTGQEPAFDGTRTGVWVGLRPVISGYLRGFTGGERAVRFGIVDFVTVCHAGRIAEGGSVGRGRAG